MNLRVLTSLANKSKDADAETGSYYSATKAKGQNAKKCQV